MRRSLVDVGFLTGGPGDLTPPNLTFATDGLEGALDPSGALVVDFGQPPAYALSPALAAADPAKASPTQMSTPPVTPGLSRSCGGCRGCLALCT